MKRVRTALFSLFVALVAALLPIAGTAQGQQAATGGAVPDPRIAPARTLAELKEETARRAERNAYPAVGLKPADVQEALSHIDSLDPDAWAAAWVAIGDRYGGAAERASGAERAALYHQAFMYYSFARFPLPNSPGKKLAYAKALDAYRRYVADIRPALELVRIPFEGREIVGYLRVPAVAGPAPVMVAWGGLDFLKEQASEATLPLNREGIASFTVDVPGTGEAPIKADVDADRMFSSILDYLQTRPEIDGRRMMVWGASWGGYWATKLAIVEKDRLIGAIDQGGPIDAFFTPEWQLKALGTREYLLDLFAARAALYGSTTLDEFLAFGPRLSLVTLGLIDRPSAPMLLFNGAEDTQVPIADLTLLLLHGSPKTAWVNPHAGHVAVNREWPADRLTRELVLPWIRTILASGPPARADPPVAR